MRHPDSLLPPRPTRKQALALMRAAGAAGDSNTFWRLAIECRVARAAAHAAWAEGVRFAAKTEAV